MPFASEAQRAWMWKNRPKQAEEWEKHTPEDAKLPERVGEQRKSPSKANPALVDALKRIQNRR